MCWWSSKGIDLVWRSQDRDIFVASTNVVGQPWEWLGIRHAFCDNWNQNMHWENKQIKENMHWRNTQIKDHQKKFPELMLPYRLYSWYPATSLIGNSWLEGITDINRKGSLVCLCIFSKVLCHVFVICQSVGISLATAPCYSMFCRTAVSLHTHFTGHMKQCRILSSFIQEILWTPTPNKQWFVFHTYFVILALSKHPFFCSTFFCY